MSIGRQSRTVERGPERSARPEVAVRAGAPGRSVFVESGNTDGWIASDTTVEITDYV
ncbi:hypothetical protein [Halosimplex marinum]|uniref:hypothetical protein n=1 Tax=Halosimplex marinum TaxID=3396620 RepID=UPI003F5746A0